jgi:hypothetical protein
MYYFKKAPVPQITAVAPEFFKMNNKIVAKRTGHHDAGGVSLRILFAAVTLAAVGFLVVLLLTRKNESQKFHYGNALTIAEYGMSEALMKLGQDFKWQEGFLGMKYNHGTYTVTITHRTQGDTLFSDVESTGKSGAAHRKKNIVLRMNVSPQGDSAWTIHKTM